ncbi:WD repeat-containing protein 49-like [Cololabis saira]|uniref:WD repeat-containing protein 49-like n=1 Tax=Cololabis saira TaxID=129043 RepID=UPI002AD3F74C|nr:WD repeat-containing protein 49-like [Cololabis saira]
MNLPENPLSICQKEKTQVLDMVYLKGLRQMAVSTSDKEVIFYNCDSSKYLDVEFILTGLQADITTMNFWSDKEKKIFSFGDSQGFLSIFVSYTSVSDVIDPRLLDSLMTGGKRCILYVFASENDWHQKELIKGHKTSITHIMFNIIDKVFISISADKNVRVWADATFNPIQNCYPHCLQQTPISAVCYNICNNKLFLANTEIAKCLGQGTDGFKESMRSFNMPVCSALYNDVFKQLVAVSVSGMVTVWDIFTGVHMDFNVNPTEIVGHTAITFDETQCKLITISQDRKVRIWNFLNGIELDVLPVQIPDDVKDIICREDRLFVSVKNSNNILDLDLKGKDNRVLNHHLLSDICSMKLNGETLIAASSNGYCVIWNADTSEVLHCATTKEKPQIHIKRLEKQEEGAQLLEKNSMGTTINQKNEQNGGPIVVPLETRKSDRKIARILISDHGFIFSWAFKKENAELIGKFRAVETDDAIITSMSTDKMNQTLLTGDSTGRVCLWDIENAGSAESPQRPEEAGGSAL